MANTKPRRKKARTKDGKFIKDNPNTPQNEHYGEKPPIINSSKELLGVLIVLLLVAIYALS